MQPIILPANSDTIESVVVGIEDGWQPDAASPQRHRTVYAYWRGHDLPARSDWLHFEPDGDVLDTVNRVVEAIVVAAPGATIWKSSSVDFPYEGTENTETADICDDQDCLTQGCPEHPVHHNGDHTFAQHHDPDDHVGASACRCVVYRNPR